MQIEVNITVVYDLRNIRRIENPYTCKMKEIKLADDKSFQYFAFYNQILVTTCVLCLN